MISIIMGAIAGISLLVGGIGVIERYAGSVTERTVIGIRRAIHAESADRSLCSF